MSSLNERLQSCDRNTVITDTVTLIDNEVAKKKGVSGVAIRSGYSLVKKLRNGSMIPHAVDRLLNDFTNALSPTYDAFLTSSTPTFQDFLTNHPEESANALLAITDKRVGEESDSNVVIRKTYKSLRGSALKHVEEALPGVGQLIDTHAPKV